MSQITHLVGTRTYTFTGLRELLAKASPARSGDYLAGVAAGSAEERVAAQMALADLPLTTFLNEVVVPYETDEVTRLIVDGVDAAAFARIRHLTVGGFRDWLLGDEADETTLSRIAPGITPEMAAAVSRTWCWSPASAACSRAFAIRSACRARCRRGCSRITRSTTRPALRRACSTV
jgi:ethanolamine ammonia-lyase large subunit